MYEGLGALCAVLTGGVIFIGSWIYCVAEYGFLLGVGIGWLPSMIVAGIGAALWPILWAGIAFFIYKLTA